MACRDLRRFNISVLVLLAGCTANPLFHVESDSGPTDATSAGTSTGDATNSGSSGLPTGEPPTSGSGGGDTTAGVDDSGAMSSGDVVTTGGPTSDPNTSTSAGPDPGTTVDPDGGESGGSSGENTLCGDGEIQPPEQCDEGMDNKETGGCLPSCQLAACGDGFVQEGVEECDLGPNNNDVGECTSECHLASCGDEIVQPPEGCDQGSENGKGFGKCSPDCVKIVEQKFMLRLTPNGISGLISKDGLFGVAAADKICQGFGLSYKAMLADGQTRKASQDPWQGGEAGWVLLPHVAYVNMGGMTVGVTGASRLLGAQYEPPGKLEAAIDPIGGLAWTGLNDDWTSAVENCDAWMTASDEKKGVVGDAKNTVNNYLHAEGQEAVCAESRKLICVQGPG